MKFNHDVRKKILLSCIEQNRGAKQTNGLIKKTLRFTQEQAAFLECLQSHLPGDAAFNDAVSVLVDLAMATNLNPTFELNAAESHIWDLFAFHALPAIHFNTVLQELGIPNIPINQTNDPSVLLNHLTPYHDNIARCFHINRAFLTAEVAVPYVLPNQPPFNPQLLDDIKAQSLQSLQPVWSLISYHCPELVGVNMLLYVMTEYQLNIHKKLSVFCPVGAFVKASNCLGEYQGLFITDGLRMSNLTLESSTFNRLISGDFLPKEPNRTLPGF